MNIDNRLPYRSPADPDPDPDLVRAPNQPGANSVTRADICSSGSGFASPSLWIERHKSLYGLLPWALTMLFAARVLGQALQAWHPQSWLPPFAAFQGSALPYWLLLPAQLAILAVMAVMAVYACRVGAGSVPPASQTIVRLGWFGAMYMAASLGRIAIGLGMPDAPAWFSAWIPAGFHLVLASFVLCLYCCFRSRQACNASRPEVQA